MQNTTPKQDNFLPISKINYSPYSTANCKFPAEFDIKNNTDCFPMQDNLIKQLKQQIQVYQKNTEELNKKLQSYDSLYIDYNSLNKNYTELENELKALKNENAQLKNIINTKNQTILDFQSLFKESKSKFELFEQANSALKQKILELENKLKGVPDMLEQTNNLNSKIADYENKLQQLHEE